jgi:hypothetical protein
MSKKNTPPIPGKFCWNELATTDEKAAKKFYAGLFSWKAEPFGKDMAYTLFKNGKDTVGGMMKCPRPGLPAHWLPYVIVADVDKSLAKTQKLGGKVVAGPFDVPEVGRIAVLIDPQGAGIGILTPAA